MARKRTARGLRPEERELWRRIAASTRPLSGQPVAARRQQSDPKPQHEPLAPPPSETRPEPAQRPALPLFRIGSRAEPETGRVDLATPAPEAVGQHPAMDRKAFQRLSRGKLRPEARLDLHGMTLAEAQPELMRFILSAQAAGRRLVLVITGKGRPRDDDGPIPQRAGALRHEVPLWLARPPLSSAVLQVARAHQRHGGGGAYYVYLRRSGR